MKAAKETLQSGPVLRSTRRASGRAVCRGNGLVAVVVGLVVGGGKPARLVRFAGRQAWHGLHECLASCKPEPRCSITAGTDSVMMQHAWLMAVPGGLPATCWRQRQHARLQKPRSARPVASWLRNGLQKRHGRLLAWCQPVPSNHSAVSAQNKCITLGASD